MELKAYKIINETTGLFSTGGLLPRWTKRGKTWSQINHVKAHLRQFISDEEYRQHWINNIPEEWTVIEFSVKGETRFNARQLYPIDNPYIK